MIQFLQIEARMKRLQAGRPVIICLILALSVRPTSCVTGKRTIRLKTKSGRSYMLNDFCFDRGKATLDVTITPDPKMARASLSANRSAALVLVCSEKQVVRNADSMFAQMFRLL